MRGLLTKRHTQGINKGTLSLRVFFLLFPRTGRRKGIASAYIEAPKAVDYTGLSYMHCVVIWACSCLPRRRPQKLARLPASTMPARVQYTHQTNTARTRARYEY